MRNLIMLAIFIFIYVMVIMLLVFKIRHINLNPTKYDHIKLQKQADDLEANTQHFRFFRSLSHQYGFVGFLFGLILTALSFLLIFFIHKIIAGDGSYVFMGTTYIGVLSSFFLNILLGMAIIPLTIKKPFFAVMLDGVFNVEGRRNIYKRAYKLLLILFIITFPLIYLSTNNYAYYTSEAIHLSRYFEIGERVTSYSDIKGVEISIWHNDSGEMDTFEYKIIFEEKLVINLNRPNTGIKHFTKEIYQIHKYIEEKGNCTAKITPLTALDIEFIDNNLSDENREIVYYIFEGFHR